MKSISRINSRKARGWFVRVTWMGDTVRKFFGDRTNGGRKAALKEAIQFRNETEAELGKPRTERYVVGLAPNNTTGVVGISKVRKRTGPNRKRTYYQITYPTREGQTGRRYVNIDQHGPREALQLARLIRQEKERELYGEPIRRK